MTKKKSTSRRSDHKRAGVPVEFTDAARGIRLQKALADAGIASRRDAEQMIVEGRVTVNSKLVTALPAFVAPKDDVIRVDGKPIFKIVDTHINEKKICILLNKPKNTICTVNDPEGRRTVIDLVQYDNMPRLFPIGRLDADSTGLLLLTNDGELAQQLTHPSYGVPKTYQVSIRGRLEQKDIDTLTRGLILAHMGPKGTKVKRAHATEVKLLHYGRGSSGERTNLSITLREGQNREIRRLLAAIGFKVRRLERVSIGPLVLKGLASGAWRMLNAREINSLKKAARQAKAQTEGIADGSITQEIPKIPQVPAPRVSRISNADKKTTSRGSRSKVTRRTGSTTSAQPNRIAKADVLKTDRKASPRSTKKVTFMKTDSRKPSGKSAPRGKRRP